MQRRMRLEWVLQILKIQQMRVRSEAYRRGSFAVFLEFVKTRNGSRGTK